MDSMLDLSRIWGYFALALGCLMVCGLCFSRASEEVKVAKEPVVYEREVEIDPVFSIINWADDPDSLRDAIRGRITKQLTQSGFLELAIAQGHPGQTKVLLDAGVPPTGAGENQPLYLAARMGSEKIVDLLFARGAKVELPGVDSTRRSPIFAAIASGSIPAVKSMLKHGASLDKRYIVSLRRYNMLTTQTPSPANTIRPPGGGFGDGPFCEVSAREVLRKRGDKYARSILALAPGNGPEPGAKTPILVKFEPRLPLMKSK